MHSNIIDPETITFWFSSPILFPPAGGHRGVQLGDLGYFDGSGEFRPIFNIFQSYEQNIVEDAHPPSQLYQQLHIDRNLIWQLDIQKKQTYTSSNVEKWGEAGSHTQKCIGLNIAYFLWDDLAYYVAPTNSRRTEECGDYCFTTWWNLCLHP